jgi:microcystin-dependent protein
VAQPYVGEIRIFAGNFAPAGWMLCDGQLLPISEYETLFNLIGTTYGGDGQSTFALPDLRGRVPLHQGSGFTLAETGGVETVTLTVNQMPAHSHPFLAAGVQGTDTAPKGNLPAISQNIKPYINDDPDGAMSAAMVNPTGSSQPHDNLQPYVGLNHIISLFGIFPSQS